MEYDPLEIEFTSDPNLSNSEMNIDALLKNMNSEEFYNWILPQEIPQSFEKKSSI